MDIANAKEAINLNNKVKAITPHTLGMVLDKVGAKGGGDTVPVGAIFDYDGSSVPNGYEKVDGNSGGGQLPVNSVYFSTVDTNPANTLGYGQWVRIGEGQCVIGQTSSDSRFNTGKKTGGSWSHNHPMGHTHTLNGHTHTLSHTHTMAHTHTITSHTHSLGDSGYACIYYGGSTFYSREINKSGLFTATSYKSVSGTAGKNTSSHAYATTLGGTTGGSSSTPASGAASTSTTSGASVTTTSDASATTTSGNNDNTSNSSITSTGAVDAVMPYIVLYIWERVG